MAARRIFSARAALILSVGVLAVGMTGHAASVAPVGCGTVTGDGSDGDPWRIYSDTDLACFASGVGLPHDLVTGGLG